MDPRDYLFNNYPEVVELFQKRMEMLPSIPLFDSELDDTISAIAATTIHDVLVYYSGQIAPDERQEIVQEFSPLLIDHYYQNNN